MSDFTEQELSLLSDAERAALQDGQDQASGDDQASAGAGTSAQGADPTDRADAATSTANGSQDDASGAMQDAVAGITAPADAAASATADDGDTTQPDNAGQDDRIVVDAASSREFTPTMRVSPVEDYDARIADLDSKFNDGEITLQEYNRARDALLTAKIKAEMASDFNEQVAEQRWFWTVEQFIKSVKEKEGIDYSGDTKLNDDLDRAVKLLGSDPNNHGKPHEWFLSEAHRMVKAMNNLAPAAPDKTVVKAPGNVTPIKPRAVPTSLSQMPSADASDPRVSDPFDYIDKLLEEGRLAEAEMAMAKLPPNEAKRFLQG